MGAEIMETPESTIDVFERIHRLYVTVHDCTGDITPFLKPNRYYHRSPLCVAVKACGRTGHCWNFEINQLRLALASYSSGRIHVCHANLVEWAAPVWKNGKLRWVLFAGPRSPGKHLSQAVRMPLIPWRKSPWKKGNASPPPVDNNEAQLILEHLRQLAARLQELICALTVATPPGGNSAVVSNHPFTQRPLFIRQFIEKHHTEPTTLTMLAKALHLSESRTSHVVRQDCGNNFRELLLQKRLHVAMQLLRQSTLSVMEVALASGFEDVAYFYRIFHRRTGATPAKYRIANYS